MHIGFALVTIASAAGDHWINGAQITAFSVHDVDLVPLFVLAFNVCLSTRVEGALGMLTQHAVSLPCTGRHHV